MKRNKILQMIGILLILGSCGILLFSRMSAQKARTEAAEIVTEIRRSLPEKSFGTMESFSSMSMPVHQIGGEDFSALLEVPAYGVILPVGDGWEPGSVRSYPCRFAGSVYDGTLVIGGADQPGQLDFLDKLEIGTVITVTDMTGAVFTYTVDRVGRSRTAEAEKLMDAGVDLTLFARDAYSLEYILVRCVANHQ